MNDTEIFEGTILKEIVEIKEGDYIDGRHKKTPREKPAGLLTPFEKAAYTVYKRDMGVLKEMEVELRKNNSLSREERVDLKLRCNILAEKIKTISKLFTFTVRSRLGLWEGVMIAIRKGFEVVVIHEYWSREVKPSEAAEIIRKERGINTPQTAHA